MKRKSGFSSPRPILFADEIFDPSKKSKAVKKSRVAKESEPKNARPDKRLLSPTTEQDQTEP